MGKWMKKAAALVTALMLSAAGVMTAYANDADAVALYQEMEAKAKEMTDINAFYDFKMDISDGANVMSGRIEMNMKANNMTDPANMKCNMYMRATMYDPAAPADSDGVILMTGNIYMADGMYYLDMPGVKGRYAMSGSEYLQNVQVTMGAMDTVLEQMSNMKLRTEGEDRIISYTMDAGFMNDLVMRQLVLQGIADPNGNALSVTYHDVEGEYVVNPEGYYTKARTKMKIDVGYGEKKMTVALDGDVGIADPGQPVEIAAPNLAEYPLLDR